MKKIYRICRLELNTLFYSPIAWLVLVIFTFQSGLAFADLLHSYVQTQETYDALKGLTKFIFALRWSLFSTVSQNLYLYMPLLTMGLISREVSSGSMKLLLSSPVRLSAIVLGKFMAMLVFNLFLAGILCFFLLAGEASIRHMDLGLVSTGILGMYLLICTYSAIGLFMSSLTSYQVVAAISTLVLLGALNYLPNMGQQYEWVRTLTYFLSLSGRAEKFFSGLITTRELAYFLLVMGLFLTLTWFRLKAGTRSTPVQVKVMRYGGAIVLTLLIGYLSSRPGLTGYLDMTAGKTRTITAYSQSVLKKIDKPVTITAYSNVLDRYHYIGLPELRNDDLDFWEPYQRFLPEVRLKYVDYYDTSKQTYLFRKNKGLNLRQLAEKVTKVEGRDFSGFLTRAAVQKQVDLDGEENQFVRKVAVGDKETLLRVFLDVNPQPGETEIITAFKQILEKPAGIVLLNDHYERALHGIADKDYYTAVVRPDFRQSLLNQGFNADTLSLEEHRIPDSSDVLVIADPRTAFKPDELKKIKDYIDAGGNLLIAGEPGKQEVLQPLLHPLGVSLTEGRIIQESRELPPDFALVKFAPEAADFTKAYYADYWSDSAKVSLSGAAGIHYQPTGSFMEYPVLVTDKRNTFNKIGSFAMDTGKVSFNPENGDDRASLPVAVALTREVNNREQRIMVLGDADIMSNSEVLRKAPRAANFYFMNQVFNWFTYGKYPLNLEEPRNFDNAFKVKDTDIIYFRIVFLGVIPFLLAVLAAVLLIRRKRR